MALDPIFQSQAGGYLVAVDGLESLATDFAEITDKIAARASMAINATARRYRTEASRLIRDEVAFPARYLDSRTDGRLRVHNN